MRCWKEVDKGSEVRLPTDKLAHFGTEAQQRKACLEIDSAPKLQRAFIGRRAGDGIVSPASAQARKR